MELSFDDGKLFSLRLFLFLKHKMYDVFNHEKGNITYRNWLRFQL